MTSSTALPAFKVTDYDYADDGGINFMVESEFGKLFLSQFLPTGGWHVETFFGGNCRSEWFDEIRRTCACYIIDRAFGGKTS